MTFTEHLGELRIRIIRSAYAIGAAVAVCLAFSQQIFQLVAKPLQTGNVQWVTQQPIEGFWVTLKLATDAGLLIASPAVVYQLCAFIFPGLTDSERRAVRYLLGGCALFAVLGVLIAYFGVLPMVMPYMVKYVPEGVTPQFRMNETVSMILMFLTGFAVAFQFPMAVLCLVYLGLLSPETLKRGRRLAIVGMAGLAAIFTPPDPISMLMMLVPLILLYEFSIWMSYVIVRRKKRDVAKTEEEESTALAVRDEDEDKDK